MIFSATSADFIEAVQNVARFSSKKDQIGARCLIECVPGSPIHLSSSVGGLGALVYLEAETLGLASFAVNAAALSGASDMLKKSKTEKISFEMQGSVLVMKAGRSRVKIPTFSATDVYNLPEPNEEKWVVASQSFKRAILAARAFTSQAAIGFRPFELVSIDDSNVCIIESGLGVFFEHDTEIGVSTTVDFKHFGLVFDEIDRVQFTDRSVFFGNGRDWCVIPRNSQPVKAYKPLIAAMQKTEKAAISLNVVAVLALQKQIAAMMKIDSSVNSAADLTTIVLEVQNEKELGVSTANTSTSIEISSTSSSGFKEPFGVGVGLFHGVAHPSFVGDATEISLKIGEGFISARSNHAMAFAGMRNNAR